MPWIQAFPEIQFRFHKHQSTSVVTWRSRLHHTRWISSLSKIKKKLKHRFFFYIFHISINYVIVVYFVALALYLQKKINCANSSSSCCFQMLSVPTNTKQLDLRRTRMMKRPVRRLLWKQRTKRKILRLQRPRSWNLNSWTLGTSRTKVKTAFVFNSAKRSLHLSSLTSLLLHLQKL